MTSGNLAALTIARKDPTPGVSQQGGTVRLGGPMRYPRAQVRTALAAAKEAGKPTAGLSVDLRETELTLQQWGFLPLPGDASVDKRIADWYVAQGLAVRADDKEPRRKAAPSEPRIMSAPADDAALRAAEAALAAAQAALAYARSMTPPAA